eukprot:3898874-Pyramimonas_sp.AAC.1
MEKLVTLAYLVIGINRRPSQIAPAEYSGPWPVLRRAPLRLKMPRAPPRISRWESLRGRIPL